VGGDVECVLWWVFVRGRCRGNVWWWDGGCRGGRRVVAADVVEEGEEGAAVGEVEEFLDQPGGGDGLLDEGVVVVEEGDVVAGGAEARPVKCDFLTTNDTFLWGGIPTPLLSARGGTRTRTSFDKRS
jgi:hypothetical protein